MTKTIHILRNRNLAILQGGIVSKDRKPALYSLFVRRRGEAKWHRVSEMAFGLESASRIYQDYMLGLILGSPYEPKIRPVHDLADTCNPPLNPDLEQEIRLYIMGRSK
jgi:hypothetical protein